MHTILIADSHTLCREALCDYMRHAGQEYNIHGFGDYAALIQYLKETGADLVLIDIDLPGFHVETEARNPGKDGGAFRLGIIVPESYDASGFDPQIRGIFPRSLSCKAFMAGIHEMLTGKVFLPHFDEQKSVYLGQSPRPLPQPFVLTAREGEVLGYLVKGASNKDIARAINLQVVTIKLHVRGICRKMKASNRTQAALMAQENGWT